MFSKDAVHHFTVLPPKHENSNFSASMLTLVIIILSTVIVLLGVKWYLIVILICISLISKEGTSLVAQTVKRLPTIPGLGGSPGKGNGNPL